MTNKIKTIGVMTAGGDCPGLNAVIRAIVKSSINKFNLKVIGIKDGFAGLIEKRVTKLDEKDVSGILPRGGTILGTSNRDNPFKYKVKKNGKIDYIDVSDRVMKTIEYNEIDCIITIGGDGTQSIALEFYERYGLPVIGVPKTIDNDLGGTDITFGFDSALQVATYSIDKLHSTAESHHRVMVVEVMGRNAGWIALHSGIAGGGDVILIPEIPYKIEKVAEAIKKRVAKGKRFSLVVVSEGAKPEGGEQVVKKVVDDPSIPVRLGGIGNQVGDKIEELTGMETRVTTLGHLQRGGSPSPFDRLLASRYGYHAVKFAKDAEFGKMTALKGNKIVPVSLLKAAKKPRRVNPKGSKVKMAEALGTCFGC